MGEAGKIQELIPIEDVLHQLDLKCAGKPGIKPSEAWAYRQVVMNKYYLPESSYKRNNPRRYIEEIEAIAKKNNIQIRPGYEYEKFFTEYPKAKAVYFSESVSDKSTIFTKPRVFTDEWFRLREKAARLSHEIVHALQQKFYPRMPIEEQEREAYYYQMLSDDFFRKYSDDPDYVNHYINVVLENDIKNSVEIDNKLESQENKDS